uniref:ATP synthase subunit a n=1 Tax=Pseudoniphargus sp. 1-Basque TaxID=2212664 RepID=A0A345UE45_9CRUS|nr:ATP synthase F0 subunit 6 [Pseudoniphargus sp. 1-Basque]
MMTNLFSIFDPSTKPLFLSNWTSILIIICILPMSYWLFAQRSKQLFLSVFYYLTAEFSPMTKKSPYVLIIPTALFIFISLSNLAGLLPYVFTPSSHLMFTLPLALSLWSAMYLYSWLNNYLNTLVHLIPQGTPILLSPFMVIIETVSAVIRPGTLAVRLAANMISGHLLLVLLSSSFIYSDTMALPALFITQSLLSLLELAVAVIQAYVFGILVTLYSSEAVN